MAVNLQQIMQVTSETLQAKVRALLPSQQGFGADLQASNVIVPIVDLTSAAEGSDVPVGLQQALSYDSQTAFSVQNTTTTIVNTTGFHRIFGVASCLGETGTGSGQSSFNLSDGLGTKKVWEMTAFADSVDVTFAVPFDFVIFLNAGESCSVISNANGRNVGSVRQVADINGNLVNPAGFSPQ